MQWNSDFWHELYLRYFSSKNECTSQYSSVYLLRFHFPGEMFSSGASDLWFPCTRDLNNEESNWNRLLHTGLCATFPLQLSAEPHFPSMTMLSVSFHAHWGSLYCRCFLWSGQSLYAGQPLSWSTQAGRLCCSLLLSRSTNTSFHHPDTDFDRTSAWLTSVVQMCLKWAKSYCRNKQDT